MFFFGHNMKNNATFEQGSSHLDSLTCFVSKYTGSPPKAGDRYLCIRPQPDPGPALNPNASGTPFWGMRVS